MDGSEKSSDRSVHERTLDRITDAVISVDGRFRLTYLNPAAEEIVGRNGSDLLGEVLWDAVPGMADSLARDRIEESLETQQETRYRRYNESIDRWVEVSVYPDGDGLSLLLTDITERETEIERYERILENLPVAVAQNEPGSDGDFVYLNEKMVDMFGTESKAEARERSVGDFFVHQEDRDVINEQLETAGQIEDHEFELQTVDGQAFWGAVTATPERIEGDEYVVSIVQDITERKEYEQRLDYLHDATREMVAAATPQEVSTIVTDTADRLLGLSMNGVHLYDESVDGLVPMSVSESSRELIGEVPILKEGFAWDAFQTGELRIYGNRQEVENLHNEETPFRSELAIPLGNHGVFIASATEQDAFQERDVVLADTLAKNAQTALTEIRTKQELREQERELERTKEFLEQTASISKLGGWEVELETETVEWTEQVYKIYEYPTSETPSLDEMFDACHPEDRQQMENAWDRFIAEEEAFDVELRVCTAEDRSRWVRITGRPVREDNSTVALRGTIQDITERYERERTLEQLVQRINDLVDSSDRQETAQVAVDIAGDVLGAPLAGVHILSEDRDRFEGVAANDSVRDELGVPPTYSRDDEKVASELVCDAYDRGESIYIEDTREYSTLAEETPARSAIIQPLDRHGVFIVSKLEVDAFDSTVQNFTQLVAQTLTTALDRVERESDLRERTEHLERERERLQRFTGVVSHDLRNPLNVAELRVDQARNECDSTHLTDAAEALNRMDTLISDLLTIAREGRQVEETDPITLPRIAVETWSNVETAAATLDIESENTILAAPGRLKQILENLFRNAIEHCGDDVTITLGDLEDGFYVADDGDGIPPGEREDVFDAGYSTKSDGTGFGLNIIQEIVQAHGWDIGITDSKNGGTRFEITGVDLAGS